VRLGLITPVLTLNPRIHNTWERDGTFDDVVQIVETADRLGFHHVTCSEHVAVPATYESTRGTRYWDALATFGFLAARTTTIRLATHVLVLGYHHPLEIAKRYGTLDRVSGGRLILGVGVGSLQEEFELLGADFAGRGERADDALRGLRAALSQREPSYAGSHFSFDGMVVEPHALQAHVPIWVGGRTVRSLRRALALGDGWAPFGLAPEDVALAIASHGAPTELILAPEPAIDPTGEPSLTEETVDRYVRAGATVLNLRLRHRSATHCCEQLEALVQLLPPDPPANGERGASPTRPGSSL
jgi:probable F420-dependent oxidoreductase